MANTRSAAGASLLVMLVLAVFLVACGSGTTSPDSTRSSNSPANIAPTVSGETLATTQDPTLPATREPVSQAESPGTITTVAGTSTVGFNGDDIPAESAWLNSPRGIALDSEGNLFIADYYNDRVRRVDAETGIITTVADGNNKYAYFSPREIALNSVGNLYVYDDNTGFILTMNLNNGFVKKIWSSGFGGMAPDSAGNLFVVYTNADEEGCVVKIDSATGGSSRVAGDCTGALAQLYNFRGIALDSEGNLFIADSGNDRDDSGNDRVRRVDVETGVIATVADGVRANALALDSAGNLFIADADNNRVLMLDIETGVLTTVAGNGEPGFSGDGGPGILAQLDGPKGIALDSAGNLYIADAGNHRIRRVQGPLSALQGK